MRHDLTFRQGNLTLRPLTEADIPALCLLAAGCREELRFMNTPPDTAEFYQKGLDLPNQLPFVVMVSGEYAGSTRYLDLRPQDAGVEIGSTWLHPRFMRTGANRCMKRLLLTYAFETLNMQRVQIKTDILNVRSQGAIAKLGAVREGILRAHLRRADGTMRDTVMFSITAQEWPEIKVRLSAP